MVRAGSWPNRGLALSLAGFGLKGEEGGRREKAGSRGPEQACRGVAEVAQAAVSVGPGRHARAFTRWQRGEREEEEAKEGRILARPGPVRGRYRARARGRHHGGIGAPPGLEARTSPPPAECHQGSCPGGLCEWMHLVQTRQQALGWCPVFLFLFLSEGPGRYSWPQRRRSRAARSELRNGAASPAIRLELGHPPGLGTGESRALGPLSRAPSHARLLARLHARTRPVSPARAHAHAPAHARARAPRPVAQKKKSEN